MNGMTGLELGFAILTGEFALLAVVIAVFALRRARRAQDTTVAEVTALVSKVDNAESGRRDALSAIIRDTYRFDAAEADKVVEDFIERERAFYNALIGVHLGRGGKTIADVPSEFTKVVAPWLRLTPKNMIEAESVEALEHTNVELCNELQQTKRVLDALMTEYNAAFLKGRTPLVAPAATTTAADTVDDHDLLSMDDALPLEDDIPANGLGDVTAPVDEPAVALAFDEVPAAMAAEPAAADANAIDVTDLDEPGEIIALDLDLDNNPIEAAFADRAPLTPQDLDDLMGNLDLDPPRAEATA